MNSSICFQVPVINMYSVEGRRFTFLKFKNHLLIDYAAFLNKKNFYKKMNLKNPKFLRKC